MRKIITIGLVILSVGNLVAFLYINRKVDKVVVIDVIRLVNEYSLKKDLELRVSKKLQGQKHALDSIGALAQIAVRSNDAERVEYFRKLYYETEAGIQQATEISAQNINEQVWIKLNPLIDEFGSKHNYRLMIGANGMGTVLYSKDALEKTSELIDYVNKKYETGN